MYKQAEMTQREKELDELNLELYRACRFAHALLDSHSRNADRIEEKLRLAMGKAERYADRRRHVYKPLALVLLCGLLRADDTAYLQGLAHDANNAGHAIHVPSGRFTISAPIRIWTDLDMQPDTYITAVSTMEDMIDGGGGDPLEDVTIRGGVLNANDLANQGIHLHKYQHVVLRDIKVLNAFTAFHFGDEPRWDVQCCQYEVQASGLYAKRTQGQSLDDSAGIRIEKTATDSQITQVTVRGYDIGVKVLSGHNFFSQVHVWSPGSQRLMTTGFYDQGNGNSFVQCMADNSSYAGLDEHGFNTLFTGGLFFNAVQGTQGMVGIRFAHPVPYATVTGNNFFSEFGSIPMKTDVDPMPKEGFVWSGNWATQLGSHH